MKLYRYMSLNEFFLLTAGKKIISFDRHETAHTNSEGICFLGENTTFMTTIIDDEGDEDEKEMKYTPFECFSFIEDSVCSDILVEFEVDETKVPLKKGEGSYPDPESFGYEASITIPEYSIHSYDTSDFRICRYCFTYGYREKWYEYDEGASTRQIILESKQKSLAIPCTDKESFVSEMSLLKEIPDGYGWWFEIIYPEASVDDPWDCNSAKLPTIKLGYGKLSAKDEEHERFSCSFVTTALVRDNSIPNPENADEALEIPVSRLVLAGNYPANWEALRDYLKELTNQFYGDIGLQPGEFVLPDPTQAFKLAILYAMQPDFMKQMDIVVSGGLHLKLKGDKDPVYSDGWCYSDEKFHAIRVDHIGVKLAQDEEKGVVPVLVVIDPTQVKYRDGYAQNVYYPITEFVEKMKEDLVRRMERHGEYE